MDSEEKYSVIRDKLTGDLAACDLRFSLMVAAFSSYRHDTVLRPYPPMFKTRNTGSSESHVDYKALEKVIDAVPTFSSLLKNPHKNASASHMTDLVYWCLTDKQFSLRQASKEKFAEIYKKTESLVSVSPPDYVFDVNSSAELEEKFEQLRGDRRLLYAYHGSSLENIHCILHLGLQGHMSKNALFGEGTYLSGEPSICLNYAPHGRGWERSALGERLSCVAVCQVIDDPSVKCQVKGSDGKNSSPSRSKIQGSEGGEIPEKYYVVRNNDMVRVCNLLIYVDRSAKKRVQSPWIVRHKYVVLLVIYILVLVAVGLYNSKSFRYFLKKQFQR